MSAEQSGLTRREFIGATAGATLLSATPLTAASASRIQGANDRVRLGLIGSGNRGRQVAGFFFKHPDAQYLAVADAFQNNVDAAVKLLRRIAGRRQGRHLRRLQEDPRAQRHRRGPHRHARSLALPDGGGGDRGGQGRVRREAAVEQRRGDGEGAADVSQEQSRGAGGHAAAIRAALPGSGRDRAVRSAREDQPGGVLLSGQRVRPRRRATGGTARRSELGDVRRAGRQTRVHARPASQLARVLGLRRRADHRLGRASHRHRAVVHAEPVVGAVDDGRARAVRQSRQSRTHAVCPTRSW